MLEGCGCVVKERDGDGIWSIWTEMKNFSVREFCVYIGRSGSTERIRTAILSIYHSLFT